MTRLLKCDYCDKVEPVTQYSAHATVPFHDEVGDIGDYEEACNECTGIMRDFMRRRKQEMEEKAR